MTEEIKIHKLRFVETTTGPNLEDKKYDKIWEVGGLRKCTYTNVTSIYFDIDDILFLLSCPSRKIVSPNLKDLVKEVVGL